MKREDIISAIKQAEGEARSIIESARLAKEDKVSGARGEAGKILAEAHEKARKSSDAAVEKALSEIRAECGALLQSGLNEAELYSEKSKKSLPKASELLLRSFEEAFYV